MLIHVHIYPDSKHERIEPKRETSLNVYVKVEAKENKANRRMIELLAIHYSVPTTKIKIITGHHSPSKILDIVGL